MAFKKSTRPCELIQREAWRVCWRQGPDRLPEVGGSGEAGARAAHPFVGLVVAGQAQEEPGFHGSGLCQGRRPMREAAPDGHPRTPAGLCAKNRDGRGIRPCSRVKMTPLLPTLWSIQVPTHWPRHTLSSSKILTLRAKQPQSAQALLL